MIKIWRGDKDVIEVSDFDVDTTNASLIFRTNTPDRLQKEVPIEDGVAKITLDQEETMSIKEGEYKYSLAIKTDDMEKTFVVGDFIVQNRI